MKKYGLIGYPVGHSYSQDFFQEKFKKLGLKDYSYDLFEMEFLNEFPAIWLKNPTLEGVNVTVPHKEKVIQYLDKLDTSSIKVGAANVIHKQGGKLVGYNTDYMAFKESLVGWVGRFTGEALILGSGGASKAVQAALADLNIPYNQVSRTSKGGDYTYDQLKSNPDIISRFKLIINSTPLGMFPNNDSLPDLPYKRLTKGCFLYDLIYNPDQTAFMKQGELHGAKTKNGLEMLGLQAEKSWDIWSS